MKKIIENWQRFLKESDESYYYKFLKYLENNDEESIRQLGFLLKSLPIEEKEAKKFNMLSEIFAAFTEEAEAGGWEPTDEMERTHSMLQILFGEYYSIDSYRIKDFIYNKLINMWDAQ